MNSHEELELKKEFQLERIILFSDAVFAIIITIMVIDLKLPESFKDAKAPELAHAFKGIILKFIGYAISFFLVARFWIEHLKIFSFLKDYNIRLLIMNLLFLFCVSLFPFAVTLIFGSIKPSSAQYHWGMDVYIVVFLTSTLAQSLLIRYMVKNKDTLCFAPDSIEKVLKWRMAKLLIIVIPIFYVILGVCNYFAIDPQFYILILAALGIISGRLIKRFYPSLLPKGDDDSRPFILKMFARRQKKIPKAKLPSGE